MYAVKQSTALDVLFFLHDTSGVAVTGVADGSFTKLISKNAGALGAMTVTITERSNGFYLLPLGTGHTDTLGVITIVLTAAGAMQTNLQFRVTANTLDDLATQASVNTVDDFLDTEVAAILAAVDTEVGAIKTKTDFLPSVTAGAAGGLFIAGTNAATTITTALTTTFTGNLTGSVASVTGNVDGNVTGSVGSVASGGIAAASFAAGAINAAAIATDAITAAKIAADAIGDSELAADAITAIQAAVAAGAVASVTGAVGSVTGNVGGNVTGSVGSIATGGIAATSFAAGAIDATAIAADAIGTSELASSAVNEIRDAILSDSTPFAGANIDAAISSRATPAQVNAEVLDALVTDTFAELAAVPGATASLKDKITWMYMLARNAITQTATTQTLLADNSSTPVSTSAVSDDATTATRAKFA